MNKIIQFIQYLKKLFRKEEIGNGTGLVEDPVDYRDVLLKVVSKKDIPIPESYSVPYILPKHNQGRAPICVGESGAVIKSEKERREGIDIAFDPRWLYDRCKEIDGMPNLKGTFFRAVFKVLLKTGAKPFNEQEFGKYRIGGYVKVKVDFDDIKRAIYEYGVVLVGFRMSNQGWRLADIRQPYKGEKTYGHAVACTSYTKDKIKFQNSWGKQWGDEWYGYFNKNNMPFSAWAVLVDLPNNWKELLKGDKVKSKYVFKNNLYHGLASPEVIILQKCYKYLGCMPAEVEESEHFGPKTLEATKIFQRRYNISPVAGYVGSLTRAKLNKLFS